MRPPADDHVLDLGSVGLADAPVAGAKLARLGELAARGWRIPDGYVVTVHALRAALREPARAELARLCEDWPGDRAEAERRCARARELVEGGELPGSLEAAIREAHERLARRTGAGDALLVAVRSSGVSEDGATSSFAGQYETFLGVRGQEEVLRHVRRCWASLFTLRAVEYRRRCGLAPYLTDLAVGVLQLVDARAAGVLFTVDPVTRDRGAMVVEGNWGLGESVVAGRVTPDHWVVDRRRGTVRERRLGDKAVWCTVDPGTGAVREAPLPDELRGRPCLEDRELLALCEQAERIEREEGGVPQDLEWAIDRARPFPDGLVILQHRPETTLAPPPAGDRPAYDPVQYALSKVFKVPGA